MKNRLPLWRRIGTPSAIYGTIVFSGLIAAASIDDHGDTNVGDTLLFSAVTLVVFWTAHVFAGALSPFGHHYQTRATFRTSLRGSLREASGMLEAAVIPSIILGLGTVGIIEQYRSIVLALQVSVVILGVLGYLASAARGARWWWRAVAAGASALLGLIIIVVEAALH